MNPPQVLVTGGTGVLGRRVVEQLDSEGIRARVFSRSGKPGTIKGDLRTGEGLVPAVQNVDTIIHCASSPFRKAYQVDVEGTRRLLEAATEAGVSHLLYISIVGIDRAASYP
jgi:nucleoside-diphosphate-sugar epimerase